MAPPQQSAPATRRRRAPLAHETVRIVTLGQYRKGDDAIVAGQRQNVAKARRAARRPASSPSKQKTRREPRAKTASSCTAVQAVPGEPTAPATPACTDVNTSR